MASRADRQISVRQFDGRVRQAIPDRPSTYVLEPKFDGLALELVRKGNG